MLCLKPERGFTDMASQAQVLANNENAQSSTGPKSESGKSISKLNAYRHGLTAQTVVFCPEEAEAFATFSAAMLLEIPAVGAFEQQLAEDMVNTHWRLNRVPALEANLIMLSQLEPAPCHLAELEDSPVKTALLESHALIAHERQLRNLQLQEQRLRRHLRLLNSQIAALQTARQNEAADAEEAAEMAQANAPADAPPLTRAAAATIPDQLPDPIGFDFANSELGNPELSTDHLEAHLRRIHEASSQHAEMSKQYYNKPQTSNVQPAL